MEPKPACLRQGGTGKSPEAPLAPGVTTVRMLAGPPGAIGLRCFGAADSLVSEGIAGGSTTKLYVPRDRAAQPWQLRIDASQGALVCR